MKAVENTVKAVENAVKAVENSVKAVENAANAAEDVLYTAEEARNESSGGRIVNTEHRYGSDRNKATDFVENSKF